MKSQSILALLVVTALTHAAAAQTPTPLPAAESYVTTLSLQNAEADSAAAVQSGKAFAQGTWTFQAYGSATLLHNDGDLYLAHVGVGYHIWDDFSINLEGIGGIVNDIDDPRGGDSTSAFGFDLLLRWHFWKGDDWSVYADGGVGMVWFESAFPHGGTHQNFTPQAGVGGTYRIADDLRLMGGVRWHHISNARKSGKNENPGYDGLMLYLGVAIPF